MEVSILTVSLNNQHKECTNFCTFYTLNKSFIQIQQPFVFINFYNAVPLHHAVKVSKVVPVLN
jgi:hypothetical protein